MFERSRKGEHALLIQPHASGPPDEGVLEEFVDLARSAGATVATVLTARIDKPNAAMLIGSGKLEEVKAAADATGADLILVNHPLTPGQERNLEKALQRRVVDRTGLILDIFSQRAQSAEGKLQVELAQLKHMATRLVRGWTHLERQRGGSIGLRGPGETQLETDRRLLQKRLEQLQKRLDKVEVQRTQMRRARVRSALPRVALVGYTNAGKSTLFNALTGAEAYADDRLFATLDPTVRRIELAGGGVVLADTVGFVRDLPHELVAAFRSTLSEAREADLLLHVVDAADPLRDERIAQVDAVLAEVGAGDLPQLLVFNKIDKLVTPGAAQLALDAADAAAADGMDARPASSARGSDRPQARAVGSIGKLDAAVEPAIDAAIESDAEDAPGAGFGFADEPGDLAVARRSNLAPRAAPATAANAAVDAQAGAVDEPPPVAPRHDRPAEGRARVWLSARERNGLPLLRAALAEALDLRHVRGEVRIPPQAARLRARLHALGAVESESGDEHGWRIAVDLAVADARRLFAQAHGEWLRPLIDTLPAEDD